jgi:hypothetical protein
MDAPRISKDLPDDIRSTIDQIVVDRCGPDPRSFMRTEGIIGHVAPDISYRIDSEQLTPVADTAISPPPSPGNQTPPPHVRLAGVWNATENVDSANANIFGGLGTLTIARSAFHIPAAPSTDSALAFYRARLLRHGDIVAFEASHNMPVTVTDYGSEYANGFLHVDGLGSGSFIEYHAPPHLHMPLDPSASGHMVLGRSEGDDYLLSAFRIPYGTALYTSANVLHADPYLVGRYLVIYSPTDEYSTVVFRSGDGAIVNPTVG